VDAYDESQEASKIADHFGSRHHIVDVGQEDIITHLEDAVWYGESFGINGQLPAKFILSKRVQQDGVRVVLSGEGADEALLGYPHLKQDWLYSCTEEERLNVQKLLDTEHALTKGVFLPTSTHEHATHPTFLQSKLEFGAVLHSWMTKEGKEQLVQHDPVGALFRYFSLPKHRVYQGAHLWTKLALAGYILRGIGDGMEMAHSIEGRPPFLDHELFSFCSSLPMKHKLHNGIDKRILRSSMKGILPSWVCTKPKHPFLAPPISIFSSPRGSELMHDMLRSKHIYDIPHIDPQRVHTFLDELKKNQDQTSRVRLEAPIMLLLSAVLMQKRISEHR
jgi:asparagine synthase (glutamine-hydrolysing)